MRLSSRQRLWNHGGYFSLATFIIATKIKKEAKQEIQDTQYT